VTNHATSDGSTDHRTNWPFRIVIGIWRFVRQLLPPFVAMMIVMVVWQLYVTLTGVNRIFLPGPLLVVHAGIREFKSIANATALTAEIALCAFALSLVIGSLIASVFSQSGVIRRSCYPYAIFLQTVPMIAIAPLILRFFGFGFQSVVAVSFIICLFPIITNATAGMLHVDTDLLDLFRLHNASRWQILTKLRLPNSIPFIIAGAKTSSGLAVIGAIVGEYFAGMSSSSYGLGYLIRWKFEAMKTDVLFASVIASTLLGVVMFAAVSAIGASILSRWYDQQATAS